MAQSLATTIGIIEMPMRWNLKREVGRDKTQLKFKYVPNAYITMCDTYSGGRGSTQEYPATPLFSIFAAEVPDPKWKVTWAPGNIPRVPIKWADWVSSSLVGAKRSGRVDLKTEDYQKIREERERKEKDKRDVELEEARSEATVVARIQLKAMMCIACTVETKSVILEPCRHFCLCDSCFEKLDHEEGSKKCPICRAPCTKYKIYL